MLFKYELVLVISAVVLGLIVVITKGKKYEISKARWVIYLYAMSILGVELVSVAIYALDVYRRQFLVGVLTTIIAGIYLIYVGVRNLIELNEYCQSNKNLANHEVPIPQ